MNRQICHHCGRLTHTDELIDHQGDQIYPRDLWFITNEKGIFPTIRSPCASLKPINRLPPSAMSTPAQKPRGLY